MGTLHSADPEKVTIILSALDKIRDAFLDAGLKPSYMQFRKVKIEGATDESIARTLKYLTDFEPLLVRYWEIKSLVQPNTWEYYKLMGLKAGNFELDEFNKILSVLRFEWGNRPNCIRLVDSKIKPAGHKHKGKGKK